MNFILLGDELTFSDLDFQTFIDLTPKKFLKNLAIFRSELSFTYKSQKHSLCVLNSIMQQALSFLIFQVYVFLLAWPNNIIKYYPQIFWCWAVRPYLWHRIKNQNLTYHLTSSLLSLEFLLKHSMFFL